jgi:Na+/H+ antiporter NhaC
VILSALALIAAYLAAKPFGITPVIPPLIAIFLAFVTKEVVTSLFLGTLLGAAFLCNGSIAEGYFKVVGEIFKKSLANPDHAAILLFSAALGGMVGIMTKCGGTLGIVEYLVVRAKTPRSAQIISWLMGLVIFFDDYSNTLLVGNTMRPVTDRLKVSREKLAYIVDSTAAPVACLAIISTWIGYEISIIKDNLVSAGLGNYDAYLLFIESIPYRFYNIYTLIFVFLIAWMGRDFGPMYTAEKRARETGHVIADDARPISGLDCKELEPKPNAPRRPINVILPVVAILVMTIAGLYYTGSKAHYEAIQKRVTATTPTATLAEIKAAVESEYAKTGLRDIVSNSDSFAALLWSAFGGSILAALLAVGQRILTLGESVDAWINGVKAMTPAFVVLLLAWSIGSICEELKTGEYIAAMVKDSGLSSSLLPALVFLISAVTAFATGTSWGTMAILIPIVITVIGSMKGDISVALFHPILLASVSSVLAGATFGDHCSPISDTTVMSSMSSGSDHMDHVRTQFPYAMVAAFVALFVGILPAGYGVSPWLLMPAGIGAMAVFIHVAGKKVDAPGGK